MKLVIEKPVTVITPTIGSEKLLDAIFSVKNQTYKCNHLLVVDGPEYWDRVVDMCGSDGCEIVQTPENTGSTGFYGHRIYAAYPHLINSDYILFLDEDNWYQPDHVATVVETIEQKQLDFSYSLRQIYSPNKEYLCDDNCESLGQWPIFFTHDDPQYLIDTSSFCFRKEFIQRTCHLWHSGWGGDRRYFYSIKQNARFDTSGKHTLCYRLDGNPNSVTKEFFDEGNKTQSKIYGGKLPWLRT